MSAIAAKDDLTIDVLRARLGRRYTIERQLGRGEDGSGLSLAHDLQLDRPVAIKVLPAEYATQSDLRERFVRETRMAASFSHPNIVPVFSVEDRDVLNFQRVEQRPDWFVVSLFGSFLLYAVSITRGISIIALLRSPLRRPPGEWIFRAFWLGPLGACLLRRAARKVPVSRHSLQVQPTAQAMVQVARPTCAASKHALKRSNDGGRNIHSDQSVSRFNASDSFSGVT